ncbi:hypothetical protein [Legionella fairfieldensis]|uniref:hypothetical protein n=1 Tax=Legionella fairfieldensis TaxID=45064 RepID=UPI00048A7AF7|nr:hypothetical protein [Legionella fairfieldensis]
MNKAILLFGLLMANLTWANVNANWFEAKPFFIFAFQDAHPTTGSDSGTTSYPTGGLDTVPTQDTGTETKAKSAHTPIPDMVNPPPANQPPVDKNQP